MTYKQRLFVREWLSNGGNGTKAALKALDCTNVGSAAACASRMLRNAKVHSAIQEGLAESRLTVERLAETISDALEATIKHKNPSVSESPDNATRLRAVDLAARLLGLYD